uniref:Golgi apparatus protein 1 n=1 Tax=Romanomermis culicivorax TaxID=13658 RepID=A0A915IXR4_ROMCU
MFTDIIITFSVLFLTSLTGVRPADPLNLEKIVGAQPPPGAPAPKQHAPVVERFEQQKPLAPAVQLHQTPLQPSQGGLLADSTACAEEIARFCPNVLRTSDVLILQCLQDAGDNILSDNCQTELWDVKFNLTEDDRFRQAALQYCSAELNTYPCAKTNPNQPVEQSHLVLCLVEYKNNMTNEACRSFLTRVESIIFTDMYLIGPFVRACKADVERLNCGQGHFAPSVRTQIQNKARVVHSQGGTLECLLQKMNDSGDKADNLLTPQCRHQVFRLADMQAEDFNLDRPLFFACRDDRERLCHSVQAGQGRVFNCLMENVPSRLLSHECRQTILVRMRMMQRDYKMSHALVTNCQQTIVENQCSPQGLEEQADHFFLTYLLLCLENVEKMNKIIPANCKQQLVEHRRLIMNEAQMQPEVVMDCAHDIELHCQQLRSGGETLHCLMAVARMNLNITNRIPLSDRCSQAINKLLQVVDVASDYKVDHVLMHDCRSMIEGVCKAEATTETDVLSCMMNHIDSPQMSDECEERLLEIQYFLARDFSLDPALYTACKLDAEKHCGHTSYWIEGQKRGKNQAEKQGPDPGYMVLTCLYRHAYVDPEEKPEWTLAPQCSVEVRRVMRERAVSVRLLPQIEEVCIKDLAEFCSARTKPGEELSCLQDKFDQLSEKCKIQVKEFTMLQSKDSRLDRTLNSVCRPVIKKYCDDLLNREIDAGEVTDCLLIHKGVPEMNTRCEAYVNHIEIVSMKDFELTFKFSRACKREINDAGCVSGHNVDKISIVRCLSDAIVKRALLNEGPKISRECRKQMKVENLKMEKMALSDWTKVDPQFVTFCKADLTSSDCDKQETMEGAIECLKDRKADLNSACRKYIFKQERLQFGDNTFDTVLNNVCAREIRQFCLSEDKEHVLHCLVSNAQDPEMSGDCLQVVQRRQREQASDVRLQPVLYEQCLPDIKQHCPKEFQIMRQQETAGDAKLDDLHAAIITCLRQSFINKHVIYASEIDPQLDPAFYSNCKQDIKRLCEKTIFEGQGHQTIMECMKVRFKENLIVDLKCKSEMERKLRELLFDIHLDEALYQVCQIDLKHYCYDTPPGNGNRKLYDNPGN